MTIVWNPPGHAAPLKRLMFPSSCRCTPLMLAMPYVLEGLYVELPCRFALRISRILRLIKAMAMSDDSGVVYMLSQIS